MKERYFETNALVRRLVVVALVIAALTSCAGRQPTASDNQQVGLNPGPADRSSYSVFGKQYQILPDSIGYREIGIASWYGKKFHGRLTANGETYDMYSLSAAHKSLPLPTVVQVTNLDNGRKAIVRVNDRGPFHDDRVIDLSYQTAVQLGFADKGTAPVVVEALDEQNYPELHPVIEAKPTFYLQVGAFSRIQGAQSLLVKIKQLLDEHDRSSDVRILQSELKKGILHKVWIGPIASEKDEQTIALLLTDAALGKPIKVQVD